MNPDTLKTIGNTHFQASEFNQADACYVHALRLLGPSDLDPIQPGSPIAVERGVLHANRAAALFALGRFHAALDEADLAMRLRPDWAKPVFRKAQACEALFKLNDALKLYKASLALEPNRTAKQKIQDLTPLAQEEEDKPRGLRVTEHIQRTKSIANCPVSASLSEFEILADVGEGNYTTVHHVKYMTTGEQFALKIVDKKKAERLSLRHGNLRAELRMERRLLSKLSHPGIIKLFLYFQDASNIYFVAEYCEGKEIWSRLKIKPPPQLNCEWPTRSSLWGLCGLRPSMCVFYLKQLVNILAYLEMQGIVHRDLKPENLMISFGPRGEERLMLIDFGTARDVLDVWFPKPQEEDEILPRRPESSGGGGGGRKSTPGSHFVGTPEFMSPEAVRGKPGDHRSDMWSLGCTAFQMMTGRTPFKGASDYLTFQKAESGQYYVPDYFTPEQKSLFDTLLQVTVDARCPSAMALKQHPYFANVDFTPLDIPGFNDNPALMPPVPTPAEDMVDTFGTRLWILAEARGEGPLSRRDDLIREKAELIVGAAATARALGEEEENQQRIAQGEALRGVGGESLFRGWLEQRSLTSTPTVLARLFPDPTTRRFSRVQGRSFVGLTFQEESNWVAPYVVVSVNADDTAPPNKTDVDELVTKLNAFKPKIVFLNGFTTQQHEWFTNLDEDIPIAPCGSTYYSLWISGILYLVLNTTMFDEEQARWLDRELLLGKFNARYVVVICTHAWFVGSQVTTKQEAMASADEAGLMPRPWRKRFLDDMQEAGVHCVLLQHTNTKDKKFAGTLKKPSELGLKCVQYETKPLPGQVRIVRVLTERALSDSYKVNELPQHFFLETDDAPANSSGAGGGQQEW